MHNFMKVNLGENWAFNVAGNSAISFSDVIDFAHLGAFGRNWF